MLKCTNRAKITKGGGQSKTFLTQSFCRFNSRLISVKNTILDINKNFGFTLAEVLITIGIIGIVAAMTLPALTGAYRRRVIETELQKSYTPTFLPLTHSPCKGGQEGFFTSLRKGGGT